jgi:hypothetical protein
MIKNISNNFGLSLDHFRVVLYMVNPTPDVIKLIVGGQELVQDGGHLINFALNISRTISKI